MSAIDSILIVSGGSPEPGAMSWGPIFIAWIVVTIVAHGALMILVARSSAKRIRRGERLIGAPWMWVVACACAGLFGAAGYVIANRRRAGTRA